MNTRARHHRQAPLAPLAVALLATAAACDVDTRPPVHRDCDFDAAVPCPNLDDPAGRIEGTIVYEGPPPAPPLADPRCPASIPRVVLLLFDADNPPPPDGTATTAVSFQTVAGSELFAGATVLPDGTVRATVPYSFPGIPHAGEFEIRAFYSHRDQVVYAAPDGTTVCAPSGFHPLYGVRNQPVAGDVGGGAVDDPLAANPRFVRIPVGTPAGTDAQGHTRYTLPDDGAVTRNVTVFLGKPFATERPMFRVVTRQEMAMGSTGPVTVPAPQRLALDTVPTVGGDVPAVPQPSASLVPYARATGLLPQGTSYLTMVRNPVIAQPDTGGDIPAFSMNVGIPASECAIGALGGVPCANDPAAQIGFFEWAYDRDGNGTIDLTADARFVDAHPTLLTTSPFAAATAGHVPWLYPLVLLTKLHDPNAAEIALLTHGRNGTLSAEDWARLGASLNKPEAFDESDPSDKRYPVVLFGSVLPANQPSNLLLQPWAQGYRQTEAFVRIGIVPVAVEIHGPNPATDWRAIVPPQLAALTQAAQSNLPASYHCAPYSAGADPDDPVHQAGVPAGRYGITVVAPSGQTWSVPNELAAFTLGASDPHCPAGVCAAPTQAMFVRVEGVEPPAAGLSPVCPTPMDRP